ncbi:hypothetical protein ScPMuIL_002884 [Solemya velum]
MGRRVRVRDPPVQSLRELNHALHDEWQQIPQQRIRRLVTSMRRRVENVIQVQDIVMIENGGQHLGSGSSGMPPAIWARGINKSYGTGSSKLHVLNDLCMTVPQGAIYGLLGPSGCGKTTLLRCIVGRLNVDSGQLIVLGGKPGTRGHGIPGRMVGYMPQETALFNDFTIGETLSYFGRIHRMTREEVRSRTEFLLDLLTLPSQKRIVKELSGGQKRRVSFAVALLQEPEILILDEPTVGVDPLLREKIWEHLIGIAKHGEVKTTIIITTHYIEEARQADKVGLMRNGQLLAEEAPNTLIQSFNMQSLEAVFLKMCQTDEFEQEAIDLHISSYQSQHSIAMFSFISSSEPTISVVHNFYCPIGCPSARNMFAQIIKNMTMMQRNIGFLVFEFLLPSLQIILFCICIGSDPFDVPVSVVNKDAGLLTWNFGQEYINALSNTTFKKVYYDDFDSAIESVRHGDAWAVISIGQNFSVDLASRFSAGTKISNETLDGSSVKLYLDMTSQEIAIIVQQDINNGFQMFAKAMLERLGMNPGLAELPLKYEQPVYGEKKPSFMNFMAPGIIISITFFMATGLTNTDVCDGEERRVIGEESSRRCDHLSVCENENSAIQLVMGTMYPAMLISGILWPIEAMPQWIRYISMCLPMTYAAEAIRCVLSRGWDVTEFLVYRGYLVSIGWSVGLLLISAIILKVKQL